MAQKQKAKEAIEDAVYEMSKPLARYRDDEDLEKLQREQEREGDPMLAYLHSKKAKQRAREGKKGAFDGRHVLHCHFQVVDTHVASI